MTSLKVQLPTRDTPGFLRRSRMALEFKQRLAEDVTDPKTIDDMIEFLLPYVTEPADRAAARECLWDASQEQFENLMAAFSGGVVDPTKAENSPSSTSPV